MLSVYGLCSILPAMPKGKYGGKEMFSVDLVKRARRCPRFQHAAYRKQQTGKPYLREAPAPANLKRKVMETLFGILMLPFWTLHNKPV